MFIVTFFDILGDIILGIFVVVLVGFISWGITRHN